MKSEQKEKSLAEAFAAGFRAGKSQQKKLNENVIDFPADKVNSEQKYDTEFYKNLFGFSGERHLETESVDALYEGDGMGIDYAVAEEPMAKVAEKLDTPISMSVLNED